ncbi:MAG: ABC transporter substrate-binding protein [Dehalococcoidia bacterium]|nr:ABC transporter substrate-binding protein [Dehalococcoidia bacterium]
MMFKTQTNRRGFLRVGSGAAAAAMVTSCAPAAAPAPAAPAAAPNPAPAQDAGFKKRWDELVAAARKEGQLMCVMGTGGTGWKRVLADFETAYPGIATENSSFASINLWIPRVTQEMKSGVHTWDVAVQGPTSSIRVLKPQGGYDPIRPLLIHPDVLDTQKWYAGFDGGFIEEKKPETAYSFQWDIRRQLWVNSDTIKPGQIKTVQDLLKPEFKGKMAFQDPRNSGHTYLLSTVLRLKYGNDFLKKLFVDQEPTILRDTRAAAEGLIRGKYLVVTGIDGSILSDFKERGIPFNVEELATSDGDFLYGGSPIFAMAKPPHPNAAKLFVNWFLTKDGQASVSKHIEYNSRRKDVAPFDKSTIPQEGDEKKLMRLDAEAIFDDIEKSQEVAKQLLG